MKPLAIHHLYRHLDAEDKGPAQPNLSTLTNAIRNEYGERKEITKPAKALYRIILHTQRTDTEAIRIGVDWMREELAHMQLYNKPKRLIDYRS